MSRTYHDFDVELVRDGEEWSARVRAPSGEAQASFAMPLTTQEMRLLGLTVARGRRTTRSVQAGEVEEVKAYGQRLFEALFSGEVLDRYRESLDGIRGDPASGLRVRLRLTEAPELAPVPWEYLYDRGLNRFLALDDETPIVRYLDLPLPSGPLRVEPPLRILVMISSPEDVPDLDVDEEWGRLNAALGDLIRDGAVVLERLERASLSTLRWRLKGADYHVFHFIGHGGVDAVTQRGVLVLEDDDGRSDVVEAETIAGVLSAEKTLRLALLNACEGGRASGGDVFAGTAQTLVQQNVPAVVAMQFEITDEAAITLTHDFYKALSFGDPVDAALTEARRGLRYVKRNELEWGTPVLYMRSADGKLFDVHGARRPPAPEELPPPAAPEAPEVADTTVSQEIRIAGLLHESQLAVYGERWREAEARLQDILDLDPGHEEALSRLEGVRREERLATLFDTGVRHQDAGRHAAALDAFLQVREQGGNYRGVDGRIAGCREAVAGAPPAPSRLDRIRKRALWGAAGAAALIGGLWFVGLLIDEFGPLGDVVWDPADFLEQGTVGTGTAVPVEGVGSERVAPSRDLEAATFGLRPHGDPILGSLLEGEERTHSIFLQEGVRYVVGGSCDPYCHDLDLALSWAGVLIVVDFEVRAVPGLDVIAPRSGTYDLTVSMPGCPDGPCAYRVQAYR